MTPNDQSETPRIDLTETIALDEAQNLIVELERNNQILRTQLAAAQRERDDASQVYPSEREGILSHISSMLSDAEQEKFGLTGRQLHMQVLRVLSAYRDSVQERDTLAATVATLTQEREEFICYCQSLQLAHGQVGPIQVARMHIERLSAMVAELQRALDNSKEIRAKFVFNHLDRICGECGHDKDDEGKCAECLTILLMDCPLLHTTTCNLSETSWIERVRAKLPK